MFSLKKKKKKRGKKSKTADPRHQLGNSRQTYILTLYI